MGRPEAVTVRDLTETIGLPARLKQPTDPVPQISDYRFVKIIGRGAFGTVWLAEETMAGVFRAIKVLRPRRSSAKMAPSAAPAIKPEDPGSGGAFEDGVLSATETRLDKRGEGDRLAWGLGDRPPSLVDRELDGIHAYQVLAKDHPHLIRILKTGLCKIGESSPPPDPNRDREEAEVGTREDSRSSDLRTAVYYVMEIADHVGGAQPHLPMDYQPLTLAALLRSRGRLPCGEVIRHAGAMLDAIEHLHKAGLHHRDIKPANVLFVGGVLKLGDMGLTASDNVEAVGTPGYLTPEGKPDDLYALGKVMYEMVTGLPAGSFPEWPGDLEPACDPLLSRGRALINELCRPSTTGRLNNHGEIRRRMAGLSHFGSRHRRSRWFWVVITGCAVLALAAGAGGGRWWVEQKDPIKKQFARSPYDGTEENDALTSEGYVYSFGRAHSPGEAKSINSGQNVILRFDDIQTRLSDAIDYQSNRPKPSLIVAARYEIYNRRNPVTGDIAQPGGEIDQLYLVIGDGLEAHCTLLYHGQPGSQPGARGRILRWVALEELPFHPPAALNMRLVLLNALTPAQAEFELREKWEVLNPAFVKIGSLFRQPAIPSTTQGTGGAAN